MNGFQRSNKKKLQSFLFFIGYPRSGSSTLASILDAHKNIVVSHELNGLKYIQWGFQQKQLFFLIEKNSRLLSKKGRYSSGYRGTIAGQYNGRYTEIKILGDKKAGGTSLLLQKEPSLLKNLKTTVNLPLKCIHIVRNPFDMITTQAYGGNENQYKITKENIRKAISFCFEKINTVQHYILQKELDIYTLKHEDLMESPEEVLTNLLTWLDVEVYPEYILACKKHLFKKPHQSRSKYCWTEEEKQLVVKKIEEIPFLNGYKFDN
jgi:hypothetical protein